jgi:P27 family predicted phage terminase small subunit
MAGNQRKGRGTVPRKPTHLRVIEGTTHKNRNPYEPKPDLAIPDPPTHLSRSARAEWDRLSAHLFMLGLLTHLDRGALAAVCAAYGRWVDAEEALEKMGRPLLYKTTNGNWIQHPLIGTANRAAYQYVHLAAEFGLSPSARANIRVNPDDQKDPAKAYF